MSRQRKLTETLHLLFIKGPYAGERCSIDLQTPCIVGRGPEVRFRIDDNMVSRHHAMLFTRGNYFWVRDLGSANGIFLNQARVRGEARLKAGDFLALGSSVVQVMAAPLAVAGSPRWPEREASDARPFGEEALRSLPDANAPLTKDQYAETDGMDVRSWREAEALKSPDEVRPDTIPGYEILGCLSPSGNRCLRFVARPGSVARQQGHIEAELVVLELIPRARVGDTTLRSLEQCVEAACGLVHSHVLRIYDQGDTDRFHYLCTEFTAGVDLASLLRRRGPLAPERALSIARQVIAGLAAAHEQGVIHGALHPGAVFVTADDWVKIADFGVGRTIHLEEGPAAILRPYLAPEQLTAGLLTPQCDLYAFGATFFEILCGRRPNPRRNPKAATPLLHRVVPEFPRRLSITLAWCMAGHPDARPQSAHYLDGTLEAIEAEL